MSLLKLLERIDVSREATRLKMEEREINDLLQQAASEGAAYAKQNAPYRTGRLMESIGYDVQDGEISIFATAPYAPYVEYGTKGPYTITAKNAQALKFQIGGRTVFAKSVVHPGNKARPFLRPGLDHAMRVFRSRASARLSRMMR
jgi:hypothetical protein